MSVYDISMAFSRSFHPAGCRFRRRHFLATLVSGVVAGGASRILAAEFWNTKDPSTWTDEEINTLTTRSPWARAAVASFKGAEDPTENANGGPTGGRGGGSRRSQFDTIIVRWESAQPILDALRAPLAGDFAGHYVLSVTNLPFGSAPRGGRGGEAAEELLERLQAGATLQAKGKETAGAGIARRNRIGEFLFGFSRDYLRLAPGDKDIIFKLDTGELTITAKFDGKAMMYHGKLAV